MNVIRDANNADVKLTLGTSAAESLIIQVLNGSSNKTAEEVHFSTATASATASYHSARSLQSVPRGMKHILAQLPASLKVVQAL